MVKIGLGGALALFVCNYALLYIFGVKSLNPDFYGAYFYAWRRNYADKFMTHGIFKQIKKNEHPETPDREEFYKLAQGEGKAYLLRFPYQEHYPRSVPYHFTLASTLGFLNYEKFLEARQRLILFSQDLSEDDELKIPHEDIVARASRASEHEARYFASKPGASVDDVVDAMFPNDNADGNPWFEVCKAVRTVFVSVAKGEETYRFDGREASPELLAVVSKCAEALGADGVTKEMVDEWFARAGKVASTPFETFIYSRAFHIFYFVTIGVEPESEHVNASKKVWEEARDGGVLPKEKVEKKLQEHYEARVAYGAGVFARMISGMYPNGHTADVSGLGMWGRFKAAYGPKTSVKDDSIQESDMSLFRNALEASSRLEG